MKDERVIEAMRRDKGEIEDIRERLLGTAALS
jgi:hypothetical protein